MRIIIDTCVALDYMQCRTPFDADSETVLSLCCMGQIKGFFTSKSFADLYYVMHHHLHDSRQTRKTIACFRSMVGILDVLGEDCYRALELPVADFEDALICAVAEREGMDYIVTRNIGDFKNSVVPAVLPKDFIRIFLRSLS